MNARTNKNMSIASIITPDYFKTCLHHDIPLSGCQRVGRSLKPSSVGVVTVQRSLLTHVGVVTLWVARSCFGVKSWKSRKLRYFDSFNLSAVIKDIFFISLSKLRGRLFTIFTAYIVYFWHVSTCACNRFPAWSCPLNRAVYSTPDSQCLECYIPFIHSRHNAKDRSLGVAREISTW